MRALTLYQPWAHAVAHLGKRIENRPWRPWASIVGTRIAIHAAAKVDPVAEAAVEGWVRRHMGLVVPPAASLPRGAIVATARVTGVVTESASPWFVGPFGWTLDEVVALPAPVPCRGAQGLWIVPADALAQVIEQTKEGAQAPGGGR